ncbi:MULTISPECIES: Nramp family divalent metal transporter [Clavibacter]|uniref:Divalent metal cation transporter n=2 Tax=Clavibacter TaxID=1573 RepID=A0A399NWK3_9MICO|nr:MULTISPECIES: Nramp family divalent metal transporter [Clavibacter]KDP92467.1 iron transporter [Clavibacter cf. michiganensis LMG 26808]RII97026.1 divalent metal cation transporter [Clavibacter michiganensis]UKF24215.1 Nramp family divalent metal transporter [Clavibacter sp. A6099]
MTDLDTRGDVRGPQESAKRWRIVGPGLVVAATGIGAGDLVATLVAGSRFGYALLWAAVLGVIIKIFLVEGAGRYSLATGRTIFEGWRTVGRWTTWYFGPYILIWGLVYGAAAMSSSALPLAALFPGVDLKVFAIACGIVGAVVVWFGRYSAFEKIIAVFVGLMFVTVVGAAIVTVPNVPALLTGLVPTIPEGGLVVALSIAGGVGGTITLAAYGYWLREKGWVAPRWMKVMRIDNSVAYVMSGIFVLSMLVVGAELLYSADIALADGEGGLVQLADVLGERYGAFMTWFFLLGFFATSFSSILGVWNGVSLMFADFLGTVRGLDVEDPRRRLGGSYYRAFILWLTIPPIGLLFLDQPIGLIIAYGVLGALFMPFLAITLLVLLNTDRTPRAWRNRPLSNTVMGLSALLFVVLGVQQLVTEVGKLL